MKSFKLTQEEHDEAFFGSTHTSNYVNDHKFAMKLQDVYLKRDMPSIKREKATRQEQQDMVYTARLQDIWTIRNSSISNFNFDVERRKRQEEEVAKLAK